MVDIGFVITLGIIFLVALVGSYLSASRLDRCLHDFDGFHITVEKVNGRIIWGIMRLESSGMELEYKTNVQDQAHIETSYLLYKEEYKDIQGIYRYADELSEKNKRARARDLEKSFHPEIGRILGRRLRNFVNTASDSLSEALTVVTGQARKPAPAFLTETGEAYLQKLGKDLIGHVGTTYDPLLEEYVGAKVVTEVLENEAIHEYVGVLKEYSAAFLELLDVLYPQTLSINVIGDQSEDELATGIDIQYDSIFQITNNNEYPLLLHKVKAGEREGEINVVVGPGDAIKLQALALTDIRTAEFDQDQVRVFFEGLSSQEEATVEQEQKETTSQATNESTPITGLKVLQDLTAEELEAQNIQFDFKIIRLLDMIVPRTRALVRHKAERYDPDQVFGELNFSLPFTGRERVQERIYRAALEQHPEDVSSMMALSKLLIKKGDYEEAIVMLQDALQHKDQLADHGRLASLQLQFAQKKWNSRQNRIARD